MTITAYCRRGRSAKPRPRRPRGISPRIPPRPTCAEAALKEAALKGTLENASVALPSLAALDRIRQLDELPLESEPLGQPGRQRLDAETLGRVVAGGDERDPELAREMQARLLPLAGQEEVVPLGGRLGQVPAGPAGDDRDALDGVGAYREDERLCADALADAGEEGLERFGGRELPAGADLGERAVHVDAELLGEKGVVADLRVRVEGEVVRGQRQVGVEERLEPAAHAAIDRPGLVVPEQAVMDDDQLCAGRGGPLEELQRGGDGADDLRHLVGAGDLHPLRPVVREGVEVE